MSTSLTHALSFDVEEFFQVANLRGHFQRSDWSKVPSRLSVGMDRILSCLERRGARATFFFLGWIAERHPHYVKACLDAGHEVASHGYEHLFLQDLGPERLDRDLEQTEGALTAAGARKPAGFRASTFTLTRETWWAFDVLIKRGYRYDSSVHPVRHPTYGVPDFEPGISQVEIAGIGRILEFPVSTWPVLGRNLPIGGGGYFRLLPGRVTRAAVRGLQARGKPANLYLHPWEFDPQQPRVQASWSKKFRHYVGLERTLPRLDRLLAEFRFGPVGEVLQQHAPAAATPAGRA